LVSRFAATGFFLAVLVALPVYLFVLSVLPKSLFRRFPFRALSLLARLLEIVTTALWPIVATGKLIGRLFLPAQKKRARLFAAREELKQITTQSEREGSLTATERAMIHNVVDFQNVTARDVMQPVSKVTSLKPDSAIEDIFHMSHSRGYVRLLVICINDVAIGLYNVLAIFI